MGYNQYLFFLLIAITCCLLYIAILSWRKREHSVAFCLFFGMLAGAFYSFGYAFELISSHLDEIVFWLKIQYIGISFGTYLWFILVLQYTNNKAIQWKWVLIILAIVPILTFTSHYTNEWHHLFYRNMIIDESQGFPLVSLTSGPFYMLHVVYSYILFIIGMGFLIQMYRKTSIHMKKQVILMIIGSCAPYLITLIYLSGILNTSIDISPLGFLFSGVFFIWGIYQYNMMKLVPHALHKVFESMKDAVIVLDLDHFITSVNQSAKIIFNQLIDKKSIGQSIYNIFNSYPEILDAISRQPAVSRNIKIVNGNEIKYYHLHVSNVADKKEKPVGKMLMLSDITETVLTEQKLLSSAKQLNELNTFKDKMFTVVAHDIRDPLSILISLMEILKEEMQDCENHQNEIVHEMEKQIQNTFALVENLLDWFRSQKGGMIFQPIVMNVSQIIHMNISLFNIQSERKRIKIISTIPDDISIYGDKEMIDLIIRNLMSNAIKFTDNMGTIYIKAIKEKSRVIISMKDSGKGIHPEQAIKLLQEEGDIPMSTHGTAGERGIGLGLSLTKEFTKINKGEMWFESTPNHGSTFYIAFPRSKDNYELRKDSQKGED